MAMNRDAEAQDSYPEKLGKILPSELTATYFLLRSFATDNPVLTPYLLLLAVVLCAAFYVAAPKLISMFTPKNRILYSVTFLFWVVAIDPQRFATDLISVNVAVFVFMASGLAAIWSFVVPFIMDERPA